MPLGLYPESCRREISIRSNLTCQIIKTFLWPLSIMTETYFTSKAAPGMRYLYEIVVTVNHVKKKCKPVEDLGFIRKNS